ncbi:MAG TPA: hypothetical protein VF831_00820 [Anaerolineales bacterium]
MRSKLLLSVILFVLSSILLTACNLPSRQTTQATTPPQEITTARTPTPTPPCESQFFPNSTGDTWEYSGTNSAIGSYSRTDTITASSRDGFTLQTKLGGVTYSVNYSCTTAGLVVSDPVQQYIGAILQSPDTPVTVKLGAVSGTTLPSKINPGDTWQQSADFDASSQDLNLSGRLVFDYSAVGYENVTVPFGTFNTMRVDSTIRVEISGLHILAGTFNTSSWMAPGVGVIKTEGTSHVSGVDFTDSMQLTRFTSMP